MMRSTSGSENDEHHVRTPSPVCNVLYERGASSTEAQAIAEEFATEAQKATEAGETEMMTTKACTCDWSTGECQGPVGCRAVAQIEAMRKALQFIADGYDNQDINHVDFRVKVYQAAIAALEGLQS